MRLKINLMKISVAMSALLAVNTAQATTQELSDCAQLQAPKTVLLVHATWCYHCKNFLPVFETVSNLPEMKGYTFYTKKNDNFSPICGTSIDGVPVTFNHNMKKNLPGVASEKELIEFVKAQ